MRSRKMLFGRKLNNRGMSLVEVIIAITILGIVAVPVLHSLTTAMVYNQKARIRQEMTLTAESIMETFKGYGLDEMIDIFNGGSGIQGVTATSYTATPGDDGAYTFTINGMTVNGMNNSSDTYTVTIVAKPNETNKKVLHVKNMEKDGKGTAIYKGDKELEKDVDEKAVTHLSTYDYNTGDESLGKFADVFPADAVLIDEGRGWKIRGADGKVDETVAAKLYDLNSAASVKNYLELKERKLIFTVKHSGDNTEYIVEQKMQYGYKVKNYPYYVEDIAPSSTPSAEDEYPGTESSGGDEKLEYTKKYKEADTKLSFSGDDPLIWLEVSSGEIYKNSTDEGLGRLFIYYYPWYDDAGTDYIEVENTAGINFQCYVLKQRADGIKPADYETKENGYKPEIKVSGGSVELFHNFDYNIATFENMSWGKTPTGFSDVHSYKDDSSAFVDNVVKDTDTTILSYTLDLEIKRPSDVNSIVKLQSTMNEKMK